MPINNIFSIDVEEWFHGLVSDPARWSQFPSRLRIGLDVVLELLAAYRAKATFFVLAPLAQQYPGLIRELVDLGHEIGTHGLWHIPIYNQTPAQYKRELQRSIAILEDISGRPILGHRAPFFSVTEKNLWAFEVMVDSGLIYDSSIFPIFNTRYGIPGASRWPTVLSNGLLEFPLATWRIGRLNVPVAGGFYGRFFPNGLLKKGVRQLNQNGYPAVIYFHPWEFDPHHPVVGGDPLYRFTHYHRLERTARTLEQMLQEFRFTSVAGFLKHSQADG